MQKDPHSDDEFIGKLRAGDEEAWQCFIDKYHALIVAVVSWPKWRFKPHLRDDVVQNIQLELTRAILKFEHKSSLEYFIQRICIHRCIDEVRRQAREEKIFVSREFLEPQKQLSESHDLVKEDTFDPVSSVVRMEEALLLRRLVTSLDSRCRDTIQQYYFKGWSYEQIAKKQGLSVNSLGSRLGRCLRKLKELMEKEGFWGD